MNRIVIVNRFHRHGLASELVRAVREKLYLPVRHEKVTARQLLDIVRVRRWIGKNRSPDGGFFHSPGYSPFIIYNVNTFAAGAIKDVVDIILANFFMDYGRHSFVLREGRMLSLQFYSPSRRGYVLDLLRRRQYRVHDRRTGAGNA